MEHLITKNINKGVNLHFIPAKRFKTVNLSFHIIRPLNRQEVTLNSLIPAIMRRGCEAFPQTRELNIYLEELFGASFSYNIKKRGNAQIICLNFKTIADKFAGADNPFGKLIDLSSDILLHPIKEENGFSVAHTSREKQNLKQFIEGIKNEKREYAQKRLIEEMYKNEEYGIFEYGYAEDLKNISPERLYNHYEEVINTSPIDIFVTGPADVHEITDKMSAFFKFRGENVINIPEAIPGAAPEEPICLEEIDAITQGKLAIGFRTQITRKHPDFFAMMLANNLFGGSTHSKLFVNVREKMSLAYYASSGYNGNKGLILVNCGIEFSKYEITKAEIFAQLKELTLGNFTDDELNFSKLALINMYKSVKDSAEAMEDYYSSQLLTGTPISPEEAISSIEKITKDRVISAIKTAVPDTIFFLKGANAD